MSGRQKHYKISPDISGKQAGHHIVSLMISERFASKLENKVKFRMLESLVTEIQSVFRPLLYV